MKDEHDNLRKKTAGIVYKPRTRIETMEQTNRKEKDEMSITRKLASVKSNCKKVRKTKWKGC